jgi:hypothetical protein
VQAGCGAEYWRHSDTKPAIRCRTHTKVLGS